MGSWAFLCAFLLTFIQGISCQTCLCARGFCEPGWVQYMDACYKNEDKPRNWNEAELACRRYGMNAHLASVHSLEENDFIFHLMGRPVNPYKKKAYWIGAHDTFKEGHYEWTDGTRYDFHSYLPNQPDGRPGENYLGTWKLLNGQITWNDYGGVLKIPSVCKYYLRHGMSCGSHD